MRTLLAATLVLAASPALAASVAPEHQRGKSVAPDQARACVLKVADTLPKIAGMKIGKSRTAYVAATADWASPIPPITVDINFTAAGQKGSWRFLCAVTATGTALVQRLVK